MRQTSPEELSRQLLGAINRATAGIVGKVREVADETLGPDARDSTTRSSGTTGSVFPVSGNRMLGWRRLSVAGPTPLTRRASASVRSSTGASDGVGGGGMAGFGVTAGELRTHAVKVEGHAQTLGQAAGEALKASQGALEVVSTNLRASADSYESQDDAAGMTFRGIEGRMR